MMAGEKSVTLIDLLDRLLEPAEPPPVSMMPQTWGWLVMAAIMVIILGYVAWRRWLAHQANAYRREALRAIGNAAGDATIIAAIVRRTALTAYPRSDIACLSGSEWLRFLDEKTGGNSFSSSPGFALAPYIKSPHAAQHDYTAIARYFVRTHVSEPGG